nr:MAG TPA: PURINE NUCLEOTIDE SYNTHESIS REPRESSOR/DNA Complex REGULATION, DNA-BINDING, REPRESSOR, PURINE [Caudoviricetes sp.]
MAKLSKDDIRHITIEYAAGATYDELAEKYNVSKAAIAKQLKKDKSLQKLTKVDEIVKKETFSDKKVVKSLVEEAFKKLRYKVDNEELSAETLLKIIDRLTAMFDLSNNAGDEQSALEKVCKAVEGVKNGEY